jgi:hypothetical protein
LPVIATSFSGPKAVDADRAQSIPSKHTDAGPLLPTTALVDH